MDENSRTSIAAVIAAAGFSRRMGEFKQLLPWAEHTVIETVVANLVAANLAPVLCVVGHRGAEVAQALADSPALVLTNPDYHQAEMLRSYQVGVRHLSTHAPDVQGTLLALGDQPHIPVWVLQAIVAQAQDTPMQIVIPSHQMRRGHPIYLPRRFWPDLLALGVEDTLRDLLSRHSAGIHYVNVDTDAIRRDMDTPEEYAAIKQQTETQPQKHASG